MPPRSARVFARSTIASEFRNPVDTGWSGESESRAFRGLAPIGISPVENFALDHAITALLTQDAAASYVAEKPIARRVFSEPTEVTPSVAGRVTEEIGVWDCVVDSVLDDSFQARIVNSRSRREHLAEFDIRDVPTEERDMVVPGGLFYWHLYRDATSKRVSELRMRRLPALFSAKSDENWTNSILAVLNGDNVETTKI